MDSMEAMFDEGHTNKLINTCLLESLVNICKQVFRRMHDLDKLMKNSWLVSLTDEDRGKYVRMHDLIRNMALKITSTGPRFMVRAGKGLERVPHEDWSEVLDRVSLVHNNIDELPSGPPICTQLTTLLLIMNDSKVLRIPNSFFTHMQRLKVLDLSFTAIQSLPESISKLENLYALSLENCRQLSYVPSLEKLKALKELKLTESQIEEVPQGIEELTSLRNLNLSRNYSQCTFPCWKLRRLSQLQCLGIKRTKVEVSSKELLGLTQLRVHEAQFHNVQELTNYVTSLQCQSLENYNLCGGNC